MRMLSTYIRIRIHNHNIYKKEKIMLQISLFSPFPIPNLIFFTLKVFAVHAGKELADCLSLIYLSQCDWQLSGRAMGQIPGVRRFDPRSVSTFHQLSNQWAFELTMIVIMIFFRLQRHLANLRKNILIQLQVYLSTFYIQGTVSELWICIQPLAYKNATFLLLTFCWHT